MAKKIDKSLSMEEIKKVRVTAYEWQCPKCGRKLITLNEKQLKAWIQAHMLKHERE